MRVADGCLNRSSGRRFLSAYAHSYTMKRTILFLMLVFLSYATFNIQQINIEFFVGENGSVSAKETIKVLVEGETDVARYNAALNKNDLAAWAELIGSSEIKVHVNSEVVNIQNLVVRPQPLTATSLSDTWRGEIVLIYNALQYVEDGKPIEGTGMFEEVETSPRISEYRLRKNVFSLRTTTGEDYILDSTQKMTFYLPKNAVVTDLNPIPRAMSITLPAQLESASWSGTILVDLTLVFRVEKGIDDEILSFFNDAEQTLINLGKKPEGIALLLMLGSILLTYVYLQYSKMARKKT